MSVRGHHVHVYLMRIGSRLCMTRELKTIETIPSLFKLRKIKDGHHFLALFCAILHTCWISVHLIPNFVLAVKDMWTGCGPTINKYDPWFLVIFLLLCLVTQIHSYLDFFISCMAAWIFSFHARLLGLLLSCYTTWRAFSFFENNDMYLPRFELSHTYNIINCGISLTLYI